MIGLESEKHRKCFMPSTGHQLRFRDRKANLALKGNCDNEALSLQIARGLQSCCKHGTDCIQLEFDSSAPGVENFRLN